jgi:hypothetical protein
MVSQCTKVKFYNGSNGGLILIEPLLQKVNSLESKVNELITYINSHVHAGSGVVPAPPYSGGPLVETQREELEDTKVLH